MKKALVSVMLVTCLVMLLVSCGEGKLNGSYAAEKFGTGARFTFKGNAVTIDVTVLGEVVETVKGTYELGDGSITFTFPDDVADAPLISGTYAFAQAEDSVTIDGAEYTKTT